MKDSVRIKYHPNGCKAYGYPVYEVRWSEIGPDGKPKRKTAWSRTEREAESMAAEKRRALKSKGREHASVSNQEQAALIRFREWRKANPAAPDLPSVIEQAIAAFNSADQSLSVTDAISQRLEAVSRRNLSERHQHTLRIQLERFRRDFGERSLAGITAQEVERWLHGLGVSAKTWTNYRRSINSIFSLARKRGLIPQNPVEVVDSPKVVSHAPDILTPAQARSLLATADAAVLAPMILQGWCGVRTEESLRLRWDQIKLDAKEPFVELPSSITKRNRRRNPPIPENAAAWLRHLRELLPEDTVATMTVGQYYRVLAKTAKRAGIKWGGNSLRHSFGTYRLHKTQSEAQVSMEMGNSPTIVRSHYQNIADPADAEEWFSLFPEHCAAPENVVRFGKTA
jgi:integrase